MQFEWTKKLSSQQIETLIQFYLSFSLVHIEQYPCWNDISPLDAGKVIYCLVTSGGTLVGYTAIYEYKGIEARIVFGPLAKAPDIVIDIIIETIRYFKSKGYLSLQVLLGMSVGTDASYLQYELYKRHRFKLHIDSRNKGTLILKLDDKADEELFKYFSENHRRSIKKAEKNGLKCRLLSTPEDIKSFSSGYFQMYQHRGIKLSHEKCVANFISINNWLNGGNHGFFMGVFENEKMVGGVLILFRGDRAEYYRGFTLPDERKIPIAHLSFYEAMKLVKKEKIPYFDFGGYNILVDKDDQVFQINKFKKGFHGDHFFYPPILYFDLKPFGTSISNFLKRVRKGISKLRK